MPRMSAPQTCCREGEAAAVRASSQTVTFDHCRSDSLPWTSVAAAARASSQRSDPLRQTFVHCRSAQEMGAGRRDGQLDRIKWMDKDLIDQVSGPMAIGGARPCMQLSVFPVSSSSLQLIPSTVNVMRMCRFCSLSIPPVVPEASSPPKSRGAGRGVSGARDVRPSSQTSRPR